MLKRWILAAAMLMSAQIMAESAVEEIPVKVKNEVRFANCRNGMNMDKKTEICSHPENASWNAAEGQMNQFFVGPPMNTWALLQADPGTLKRLTCNYCIAGASNGPLAIRGKTRPTNVVFINNSFIVTGPLLGPGDKCIPPYPGVYEGLCQWQLFPSPGYSQEACAAACTRAWQQQVVRFTCEHYEYTNFDGDPDCDNY